jgi:hypothetical protein
MNVCLLRELSDSKAVYLFHSALLYTLYLGPESSGLIISLCGGVQAGSRTPVAIASWKSQTRKYFSLNCQANRVVPVDEELES